MHNLDSKTPPEHIEENMDFTEIRTRQKSDPLTLLMGRKNTRLYTPEELVRIIELIQKMVNGDPKLPLTYNQETNFYEGGNKKYMNELHK